MVSNVVFRNRQLPLKTIFNRPRPCYGRSPYSNLQTKSSKGNLLRAALWTRTLRRGSVYSKQVLKGIFVEGVSMSICQTLRQWWLDHQSASVKDLVQNSESVTGLQRKKLRSGNMSDSEGTENRREPRLSMRRQPHGRRVMIEQPSQPPKSLDWETSRSTLTEDWNAPTAMSMSDVVAAVKAGEVDLQGMELMISTPFCRLCHLP